jgi:predicted MPP superfamily phosphohydrolase
MRRKPLPAPRPVLSHAPAVSAELPLPATPVGSRAARGDDPRLGHTRLAEPSPARPRLRRLFDPVAGWFRVLERRTNLFLSREVWGRVPGLDRPYGWQLDRSLTVSDATVRLPRLAPGLDGLRLLFVSDIHAGPFVTPVAIDRTLRRLGGLGADVVLVGGDFTTTTTAELEPFLPALGRLEAPLGVFGVLGNHDHYTESTPRVMELVERAGVRLLHNDSVLIERDGARLRLAGIDDLNCGRPDLDAALRETGRHDPVVLLSHNPDVFFAAAARGVSLVLAGHTHGGQWRIPGLPVLARMSRYRLDEGRFSYAEAELIVSRGLGVVGAPLRLFCPPEAVLLELRRG